MGERRRGLAPSGPRRYARVGHWILIMSAIFISHSSVDRRVADEVHDGLRDRGYGPLFLDNHLSDGIPVSANWEATLYRKLHDCRALVLLCSEASMRSQWCFAEFVAVRSAGKVVIPLVLDGCEIPNVIGQLQGAHWRTGNGEAFDRLAQGLAAAGLSPVDRTDWAKGRPPYPGLYTFEEADRAVFFGRDAEVEECVNQLNRVGALRTHRLVLVVGPSGSGKSSVVHAGVIPRLRVAARGWTVLGPLRPGSDPLDALARACGVDQLRGAGVDPEQAATALIQRVRELAHGGGEVVLIIDQFEELLVAGSPWGGREGRAAGADAALAMLRRALDIAVDAGDIPLIVLATLRADFLATFQQHAALRGVARATVQVDGLDNARLRAVIEAPAVVADLPIEPGLADKIIADAGAADVLPLVSSTLHRLWSGHGLTLDAYAALGGLERSIAQDADDAVAGLDDDDLSRLRDALLAMIQLDDEHLPVRRPGGARLEDMPKPVRTRLRELVSRRLLVLRGDERGATIEIAHEALIRQWGRLWGWLDEDREFLIWGRRLDAAQELWEAAERHASATLRGPQLQEAQRWLESRAAALTGAQRMFISTSVDVAAAGAETRRREQARRRELELQGRVQLASLLAEKAERARDEGDLRAAAIYFAAALENHPHGEPDYGELIGDDGSPWRFRSACVQCEVDAWERFERVGPAELRPLAFISDEELVGVRPDGHMVRLNVATGVETVLDLAHSDRQSGRAISAADRLVALEDWDHLLRVHSLTDGSVRGACQVDDTTMALEFVPGRGLLLRTTYSDVVQVFSLPDLEAAELATKLSFVYSSACSPEGSLIALAGTDVELWDPAAATMIATLAASHLAINAIAFSPDGSLVAAGGVEPVVRVWRVGPDPELLEALPGSREKITQLAFAPDGRHLASLAEDGVRAWRVDGWRPAAVLTGDGGPLVFSGDGRTLLSGGPRGVRVFDLERGATVAVLRAADEPVASPDGRRIVARRAASLGAWMRREPAERVLRGHDNSVQCVAFSPLDPDLLASAAWVGGGPTLRLWRAGAGASVASPGELTGPMRSVAFSPDAPWVAASGDGGLVRVYDAGGTLVADLNDPAASPAGDDEKDDLAIAFQPGTGRLASARADGSVVIWNVPEQRVLYSLAGHHRRVDALAFSPDGEYLAVAGVGYAIVVWRMVDRSAVLTLAGHEHVVDVLRFSPDGTRLVSGSWDKTARVWAMPSGEALAVLAHDHPAGGLAFPPDGSVIATSEDSSSGSDFTRRLCLWDPSGRGPLMEWTYDRDIRSLDFDTTGRRLAAAVGYDVIVLDVPWDLLRADAQTLRKTAESEAGLQLGPNAELLAGA
ncbi:MAG TPA: TIR domain-containing protein [Solirubrobacter sp.]